MTPFFRLHVFLAATVGLWLLPPSMLAGPVTINEILAVNQSAVERGNDFPDFVELYNSGDNTGQLTGEQTSLSFGPLRNGVSIGRYRTSLGIDIVPLSRPTFGVDNPSSVVDFRKGQGQTNAPPLVGRVVISEIMFQPSSSGASEEFIELRNLSAESVPLYDPAYPTNTWSLRLGVTMAFAPGTTIPARGFLLVVDFDPEGDPERREAFRRHYSVPDQVPVVGPYSGRLNDLGETIELSRPDTPQGPDKPNAALVPYFVTESIHYLPVTPWPAGAAGSGNSLQRLEAAAYGNDPINWVAATPTAGQAFLQDQDQDGMPDDWETTHQLDPYSASDANDDPDADRADNLAEYLTGTHPRDAQSVFRILCLQRETGGWFLQFKAVIGQSHILEMRSGSTPNWQPISSATLNESPARIWVPLIDPLPANALFRLRCDLSP
jgi:hypothetical protein